MKFYNYRPKKLSGDRISDVDVIKYTLTETEKTEKEKYHIVVMLHPTSPLRKKKDVEGAIKLLVNKKYDPVWTVSKTDSKYHPDKQLSISEGKLSYFTKKGPKNKYRQQLSQVFNRNSVAYVMRSELLEKRASIINNKTGAYLINTRQISIDTLSDLVHANKLFK